MTPREMEVFDRIVAAALLVERCPMNHQLGIGASLVTGALARAGHIRIEVYALNYRVVEIMSGPHAGTRTAEQPEGKKPYRVIDKNGDQWISRGLRGAPVVRHREMRRAPAGVTLPRIPSLEENS